MKRRVIQIANSTQLISLPRKWALKNNIKKGDELEVTMDGPQLTVGTTRKPEPESYKINFPRGSLYIRRALSTLYKLGYDEVEISYDDPALINQIKPHCDELLGFEIIQQSSKRCVVKNVALTMESEFDNILRRIFLMLVSFGRESYAAISAKEFASLEGLADLEKTNNRLSYFCERVLNKYGYPEHKRECMLHTLVGILEQVADAFGFICHHLAKRPQAKLSPQSMEVFVAVVDLTDQAYQLFYNFDLDKLAEFKTQKKKVENEGYESMKSKMSEDDILVTHHLMVISYLLHHATE